MIIKACTENKRKTLIIIGHLVGMEAKYQIERNKITVINKTKSTKISISQPKGDIEMKNINYRPYEKRYIGRKQIHNNIITVYAKTQKECAQKLREKVQDVLDMLNPERLKQNALTVEKYWDQWYKENKEPFIADTTRNDFKILRNKIKPLFKFRLNQLTKSIILDFLSTLETNRTKEKVTLQLKSMLTTAVKERKIKYNPFDTIIFKTAKRKPKPPFNYDEQKLILENLKGKDFEAIILLYLCSGLRRREMPFADIESHIDKNNIFTTVNLKGREREVRYKRIKLSPQMVKLVLDNKENFHKYNNGTLCSRFDNFLEEIGVTGSIVTCRHTFATNCFYLGKDSLIISREMGHSTSSITKDNYIDIDYNLSKEKLLKLYNNLYNLD